MRWQRTCQECGHKQLTKCPRDYKDDSWTELKCQRCKSTALDYGQDLDLQDKEV